MEPIATYAETRLEGRRSFALLPDRVVVSGRSIAGEVDLSFQLATLSPVVSRLRLRSRYFVVGFVLLFLPWLVSGMVAVVAMGVTTEQVVGLPFGVSVVGLIMAAAAGRKVEYVRFNTEAGIVALDVARAGGEAEKFDSFVDALTNQISIAKRAA